MSEAGWFRETPESLRILARERFLLNADERQRELTEALGQIECGYDHGLWCGEMQVACPGCGAVV